MWKQSRIPLHFLCDMSIYHKVHDLKRRTVRKAPKSKNFYLRSIQAAYSYAAQNLQDNKFAKRIAKRLSLSRSNRPVMSIAKIAQLNKDNQIAVVAATVTNDERMLEVPKMTVCAMHFTETARARIEKVGGKCMSFDQLLLENPTGKGCLLIQGSRKARKEYKYFGAAGLPHSKTHVKGTMQGRKGARGPDSW